VLSWKHCLLTMHCPIYKNTECVMTHSMQEIKNTENVFIKKLICVSKCVWFLFSKCVLINVFILCVVCTFKLWLIYVWLCVLFMFWKCVCCVFSHLSDLSFKSVNWQNCFTVYTWEYIFVIYYSYPIFKLSIILLSCNRFMISESIHQNNIYLHKNYFIDYISLTKTYNSFSTHIQISSLLITFYLLTFIHIPFLLNKSAHIHAHSTSTK
jgi:hypothetical protein